MYKQNFCYVFDKNLLHWRAFIIIDIELIDLVQAIEAKKKERKIHLKWRKKTQSWHCKKEFFVVTLFEKKKKFVLCVLRVTKCSLFFQFENCSNVWFKWRLLLKLKKRNHKSYLVKITFSHFQAQHWWDKSQAKIIMHKWMCPLPLNDSIEPWIK